MSKLKSTQETFKPENTKNTIKKKSNMTENCIARYTVTDFFVIELLNEKEFNYSRKWFKYFLLRIKMNLDCYFAMRLPIINTFLVQKNEGKTTVDKFTKK